jgi:hypothetical protein
MPLAFLATHSLAILPFPFLLLLTPSLLLLLLLLLLFNFLLQAAVRVVVRLRRRLACRVPFSGASWMKLGLELESKVKGLWK